MKLFGSSKSKATKSKTVENVTHIRIIEVASVHFEQKWSKRFKSISTFVFIFFSPLKDIKIQYQIQ